MNVGANTRNTIKEMEECWNRYRMLIYPGRYKRKTITILARKHLDRDACNQDLCKTTIFSLLFYHIYFELPFWEIMAIVK